VKNATWISVPAVLCLVAVAAMTASFLYGPQQPEPQLDGRVGKLRYDNLHCKVVNSTSEMMQVGSMLPRDPPHGEGLRYPTVVCPAPRGLVQVMGLFRGIV
jgi:hypothetical protein